MKRLFALLLAFTMLLPVFAAAELDEDDLDYEEIVEDVDLDEEDPDEEGFDSAPVTDAEPLSEELRNELLASLESADYVPKELDNDNLYINKNLPDNIINILLIGVDTRNDKLEENDVKLADVQMILSLDTANGSVKLSSILRDTLVINPFTGKVKPINQSYQSFDSNNVFHDNPQRSVATINYNFEMNVQYYVTINFRGVAAIIDKIGGIDMDLTEGEAANINYYLKKNARSISRHYDTPEAKAARVELKVQDGIQHLDGLQALMYARLRQNKTRKKYNLGDDWQRTYRARHLLDKLLQKVLSDLDIWALADLLDESIEYINTNMDALYMGDLLFKMMGSGIVNKLGSSDSIIGQFRIPMGEASEGTKTWSYDPDSGKVFMSKRNGNFQKNIESLHEFIYGQYYPAN